MDVLVLSGGGVRGAWGAGFLAAKIGDYPLKKDMVVVGVSAGAMLGVAYGTGMTATDVLAFFMDASRTMSKARRHSLSSISLLYDFFDPEPLRQLVSSVTGHSMLESLHPQVGCVITDPLNVVGRTYFAGVQAGLAALASGAAPTYFEATSLGIDGGLCDNLPVLQALVVPSITRLFILDYTGGDAMYESKVGDPLTSMATMMISARAAMVRETMRGRSSLLGIPIVMRTLDGPLGDLADFDTAQKWADDGVAAGQDTTVNHAEWTSLRGQP